jgi:hypothetical protein
MGMDKDGKFIRELREFSRIDFLGETIRGHWRNSRIS